MTITHTFGYEYRPDGCYFIRKLCRHCGEGYDVLALAPITPESAYGLCSACEAVRKMELEK